MWIIFNSKKYILILCSDIFLLCDTVDKTLHIVTKNLEHAKNSIWYVIEILCYITAFACFFYFLIYIIFTLFPYALGTILGYYKLWYFFPLEFSFTDTDDSQGSRGREGTIFIPLYHFYLLSNIDRFRLYLWDDYRIFLIAWLVITRLPLTEIYHLTKLPFYWLMMWLLDESILAFCYISLTTETSELKLASTMTLVFTSKTTNQVC